MSRAARAGLVAAALIILLAGGALLAAWRERPPAALPARAAADRPTLLLLSSLPLVFGEQFSLAGGGSPALDRLKQRYDVRSIALADRQSLAGQRLLLMAHARAQTADALVDLDAWVRGGGRLLLLADPALDWPSERPLGDPLRPAPGFADTGLLAHWGLAIEPAKRGSVVDRIDGRRVALSSPGRLSGRRCAIRAGGLIARCRLGRGKATIVADADLLHPALSGADAASNLDAVLAELGRLER